MEEEARERSFDEGKMKGVGCRFGSVQLHPGVGGRHTATHGAVARTKGAAAARASEGGRGPPSGPTWAGVDRELGQCGKNPKGK
jgi:hypothetical protein